MRNIIWLFIDSLSQLLVNEEDSPFIYNELNNSLQFTQCVTTTPYTGASYYSQITGRYAQHHGYNSYHIPSKSARERVYSNQTDIITKLREAGYYTLFTGAESKLARMKSGLPETGPHMKNLLGGYADTITIPQNPSKAEFEYAARPGIEPFLWFFHFGQFLGGLKSFHYRKGIREKLRNVDARIKKFVENNTIPEDIIIYSSDHGFGTRKRDFCSPAERHHGVTLMECCIRIVFSMKNIGIKAKFDKMVRGIDIGPTVLGLISQELDDTDGINLLSYITKGEMPDLEAVLETGPHESSRYAHSKFGIRDNWYKYVFNCKVGKAGQPSERLHSATVFEPKGDLVDDDGIIVNNSRLLKKYRKKVLDYLEQYNLTMQRNELLELCK